MEGWEEWGWEERGGHPSICTPQNTLHLLIIGQQFAELRQLLRSVPVSSTLPDILNYLLRWPVESGGKKSKHFNDDIIAGM